jgi:PAS domain S-box-containing protein
MRKAESNKWFRRYAVVLVVACIGFFLTFSGFLFVRRVEIRNVKTELLLDAQKHLNALEKEVSLNLNALQSLHSFFKGSEVATREGFRIFAEDMLQYTPGFQALEWIPRVLRIQREEYERSARIDGFRDFQITEHQAQGEMIRAGEREEYFPVYFVEPYKGNEIVLGYDLASNPVRKAALQKSRDTGQMTATARITLVQETGNQYGLLIFMPVYQKMTSTDTIEARRKNLIGFVLGVYRIDTIVNNAFKHLKRIDSYIYDKTSPPDESFLYAYPGQTASNSSQMEPKDRFKVSHQLNIADRQWQLVSELPSDFAGYFPMAVSWGALAGGLLVTCLLAAYLATNIKRTIQIEEIANELSVQVAERKQTGEALRESEKRYRELFENSTDFVYTLDLKGNFTDVNNAAEDLTGYTKNELLSMNYNDYTPEDTHERILDAFNMVFKEAKPLKDFPFEVIIKDGTKRYFETCVSPLRKGEEIIGFQGSSRDITARKRTEDALNREKERFEFLVEESPLGVALIGKEGSYKYINPKFTEIFGYTLEDIPTRQRWFKKAFPDEKYRRYVTSAWIDDQKKYGIGELRPRTFEAICKDGSKKTIRYRPVTMESGDQLLIYEDITETQHLEDQLRQAQKMEAIGTLAGGIAHDFNNILASLIGYTELAVNDVDDKQELLEDLQEVFKAGNRAKDLVSQILAFSRQSKKELGPVKVKLIAKEALKLLRSSLPTTIEIRNNILSDALVMADSTQIHQVLMNLCTNAGQAMQEEGGILEVSLTDVYLDSGFTSGYPDINPGTFLKLTVSDTGRGIAPDILNKIFDPFFTTKEKGEGTGLGLSVVHGIIKSLGGTLTVYSEPEKGAEFSFYLPIIEREVKEEQGFEAPLSTGTERILFVDDEQPIRDMSKKLIESLGYHVEVRSNGIEALELFKANPERFDLVITDLTMPNMTGDRLAEQLMSVRSDIPIILCTGFSARIDEKKSNAMGIRAFVLKPIIQSDIARIIRTVLDEVKS